MYQITPFFVAREGVHLLLEHLLDKIQTESEISFMQNVRTERTHTFILSVCQHSQKRFKLGICFIDFSV